MYAANIRVSGPIGLAALAAPAVSRPLLGIPSGDPLSFGIANGAIPLAFGLAGIAGLRAPLRLSPILSLQVVYKGPVPGRRRRALARDRRGSELRVPGDRHLRLLHHRQPDRDPVRVRVRVIEGLTADVRIRWRPGTTNPMAPPRNARPVREPPRGCGRFSRYSDSCDGTPRPGSRDGPTRATR